MKFTASLALTLLLAACPGPQHTQREWQAAIELDDGAILSFWGDSAADVFAVGGTMLDNGGGAIVLRHQQSAWQRVDTGPTPLPTLWWVQGFGPSDVWAVGELGTIVHYDGVGWTVEQTGPAYTLWGVWGPSTDQLWAVGGTLNSAEPGVVLAYDGNGWTEVLGVGLPGELLFKVWGTGADNVYVVGTEGSILHWDGQNWARSDAGTTDRLLTVRGRGPDDIYAVGGLVRSSMVHHDAAGWSAVSVDLGAALMGVWTAPDQPVLVSGFTGLVAVEENGSWENQTVPVYDDLHAAWGDTSGNFLVGGGNLLSIGTRRGVIVSSGPDFGGNLQ